MTVACKHWVDVMECPLCRVDGWSYLDLAQVGMPATGPRWEGIEEDSAAPIATGKDSKLYMQGFEDGKVLGRRLGADHTRRAIEWTMEADRNALAARWRE